MGKIVSIIHHNIEVKADSDTAGKHRDYCLCWRCAKFIPSASGETVECKIANLLYRVDIICEITTPVFYCKKFKEK